MKKAIVLVAAVVALVSCNSTAPETTPVVKDSTAVDTTAVVTPTAVMTSTVEVTDTTK